MDKFIIDLLDAREKRYEEQIELVEKYKNPIISFMLNTPGIEKRNAKLLTFHKTGVDLIQKNLKNKIVYSKYYNEVTGMYYLASVKMDSLKLKTLMIDLENSELGRLFDIDVFDENMTQITRSKLNLEPRPCLICNNNARLCIREKKHSFEELVKKTNEIIDKYIKK